MITVPSLKVALKLDTSTTNRHSLPPHEFALMAEIHGNRASVSGQGVPRDVEDEDFDVYLREEYTRLGRKYGPNKDTGRPWVEDVFGRFQEGRFETTVMKGIDHYSAKAKLSPQQKGAATRKANKAKQAEEEHGEDALAVA